jgi:drug/metabolite transporter (DMT)-like permease
MLNGEKTKLFGDSKYVSFILLLRALFGFGGMSFGFLAIEHLPIGDASTLVMQSPILSAILGYFILNEPWRLAEFAATIISMIGVTLISRPSFIFSQFQQNATEQSVDKLGVLFAVLAALCAGCAFITVRMLGTSAKMPWQHVVFSAALGQCILSTACMFLSGQKFTVYLSPEKWLLLICGSLVGTFSQFAMTIGIYLHTMLHAVIILDMYVIQCQT